MILNHFRGFYTDLHSSVGYCARTRADFGVLLRTQHRASPYSSSRLILLWVWCALSSSLVLLLLLRHKGSACTYTRKVDLHTGCNGSRSSGRITSCRHEVHPASTVRMCSDRYLENCLSCPISSGCASVSPPVSRCRPRIVTTTACIHRQSRVFLASILVACRHPNVPIQSRV